VSEGPHLHQWAISGHGLLVLGLSRATVAQLDPLLRQANLVPASATLVCVLQTPDQDMWLLRYEDVSFPPLRDEYDGVATTLLQPRDVGVLAPEEGR
jgi:hypothetical protein